jgi:heme exporter protein C
MSSEIPSRSWPWVAIGVSVAVALTLAMISPADAVQGELVRIMYVHVPAAWLAYLAFAVTLVCSAGYLFTRNLIWDRFAASSAEVGVYFTALAIALGMIWAKPTWGVWWTWDARLTLTAVMFFVYVGYLALRRTTDDPRSRAGRAAVLGIVGAVQIPLVHFSVVWWRTLHQPASILRPDGPAIQDPVMIWALLAGVLAFSVIYVSLMVKRGELHRLNDAIHAAELGADRPVAGASVAAPDLDDGVGHV